MLKAHWLESLQSTEQYHEINQLKISLMNLNLLTNQKSKFWIQPCNWSIFWRKFQADRSRDKLSTLQGFYKAGRTHDGQKLYIEELYKRKESGTKKVAISFVYVCLYFAGCLLALPHFWRTLLHSQLNVGFCQKLIPRKTFFFYLQ